MFRTSQHRRLLGRRNLSLLVLVTGGLLLGHVNPAAASHLGDGVVGGIEDQVDAADPANSGTVDLIGTPPNLVPIFGLCAKAADDEYVPHDADTLSAQYTLTTASSITGGGGTLTLTSGSYTGPVTIEIKSQSVFYFGPQGTHYGLSSLGSNCGATNLGHLSPVPAAITVSGNNGTTSFSCTAPSTAASFYREGADVMGATATFVSGDACGATTVTFTGVYQPPCGLPFLPACINGRYTQH